MSSTHLRLEGPDLPSLLDQVRAEYGPGARVVHAERIRRGGVGGFFARERYHLEVEVHEAAAAAGGPGPGATAGRGGGRPLSGAAHRPDRPNRDGPRRAAEPGGARRPPASRRHPRCGRWWQPSAAWAAGAQPGPTLLAALTSTAARRYGADVDRVRVVRRRVVPTAALRRGGPLHRLPRRPPLPEAAPVAVPERSRPTFVRLGADPWPVPAAPDSAPEMPQQPVGSPATAWFPSHR